MPEKKIDRALNDETLILEAKRGNMQAFEQLVQKYDQKVLSMALNYTRDPDEAMDVYQEVFIRVYRALPKFQFKSKFSTWMYRIVVNVCSTHHSRRIRRPSISLDQPSPGGSGTDSLADRLAGDSATDQGVLDREIVAGIETGLQRLSPKQRSVFMLRHYQGFKLREIASILECAEGTVKRHLFTATTRLRSHLTRLGLKEGSYDAQTM